ncbi:DNA polymerase III subunit gamma and tau [Actinomadura scrupuli]|uniref:DNA polymerase III subunit gamma and tau n=1 Tax=Actinomadura scrupuli TaxID=559629 RepID=UPI003D9640FA
MSLALYRKYRPATFAELKGQEHVAEPLQQALRNGRINHAYLFSGPRGCGKTSSARILARSLNCEQGPTPDPCGVCDSCVALGPGGAGHLDVIEIDAASHGGVDDARDLRERAFFAPVAARFKIYIIDEAHMVTKDGFNALLKLVEEPPPHLKFVFATTEPEKVLGTIRSRTHHYPFRLIPPGVLRELLEEILQSESVPYEPTALPLVVRAGAGSARDSLSILDQLLAGADEAGITYARAVSLLGYTDASLLDEVVDAFAARDGAAVFAAIDRVIESGQDPRRFAADLLERFRDLVILSNVPEAGTTGLLDVPSDELKTMERQASGLGRGELTRAADLLHTGLTEMRGATSPRLLLELICARILLPGAYDDEMSVLTRMERLERRLGEGGDLPVQSRTAQALAAQSQTAQSQPAQSQTVPSPAVRARTAQTQTAQAPAPVEPPPARQAPARPAPASPAAEPARPAGPQRDSRPVQGAGDSAPAAPRTAASDWPEAAGPGSGRPGAPPVAAPVAAPVEPRAPVPTGGLDVAAVRRDWTEILEAVKRKSRVAGIFMDGVQVASLEGTVLTLAFASENNRKAFAGRDAVVREVLQERFGVDWRIDAVPAGRVGGAPAQPSAPPTAQPPPARPGPAAPAPGPARQASPSPAAPPSRPARRPGGPQPSPEPPDLPPLPPPPVDESEEVDPEGDADAGADEAMSGMVLIQRELGGQIIKEIDNT